MDHGAARLLGGGELLEHLRLELVVWPVAVGAPFDGDEGVGEPLKRTGTRGEGQLLRGCALDAGHVGAVGLYGCEEEVLVGVVDDADDGLAVDGDAEGDAGVGEGMDEVCGS